MHARGAGWALASCAHARHPRIVWLNFDTPLVRRAPFPLDRLPSQTQVVLLFFDASHYWLFVLLSFAQLCACAVTSRAFSSAATWRLNSALFVVALKLTRFSGGAFRALFDFIFCSFASQLARLGRSLLCWHSELRTRLSSSPERLLLSTLLLLTKPNKTSSKSEIVLKARVLFCYGVIMLSCILLSQIVWVHNECIIKPVCLKIDVFVIL